MNSIILDGVTYVKAKDIAKKYHYTTDYVGQLCRSGKINCHLVGRSWYVSEDSLNVHKNSGSKKNRQDEITLSNNVFLEDSTDVEPIEVRPFLTKRIARSFEPVKHFVHNSLPKFATYSHDNVDLLPHSNVVNAKSEIVVKPMVPNNMELESNPIAINQYDHKTESLTVEEKEQKSLKIHNETRNRTVHFTKLPKVSLKGKVKVEAVKPMAPESLQMPLVDFKDSHRDFSYEELHKFNQSNALEAVKVETFSPTMQIPENFKHNNFLHFLSWLMVAMFFAFSILNLSLTQQIIFADSQSSTTFIFSKFTIF